MDLLNKLYYDERTGLQSGNKLYDNEKPDETYETRRNRL